MICTFSRERVQQLVEATKAAPVCHRAYSTFFGGKSVNEPGLNLVGDVGVYLMSNRVGADNRGLDNVAYARESDPTQLPLDEWLANKRAIFGGDDGIIHIPLAEAEAWLENARLPFLLMQFDKPGRIRLRRA